MQNSNQPNAGDYPPTPSLPEGHPPIPAHAMNGLPIDANSCPYSAERQEAELNPLNNMPAPNQLPAPGQAAPLSTEREKSTIPMGGKHEGQVWVYPSEQVRYGRKRDVLDMRLKGVLDMRVNSDTATMTYDSIPFSDTQMFFNAMRRKNWDPKENDMGVVVPIHNAVNERAWHHILEWESMHQTSCAQPRLLKFQGRPKDYSPKARIRQLLGYKLPFDRHDWTVDRCGKTVTYIIDFYSGAPGKEGGVSFYLDVRPKLSIDGIGDRIRKWWTTGSGLW
ncbi:hypothetical protein HDV00_007956 [Rhizophlyctis rosea]|nr:hypothetical protein HDV00_007956 [Rhizophlyctis rosea]